MSSGCVHLTLGSVDKGTTVVTVHVVQNDPVREIDLVGPAILLDSVIGIHEAITLSDAVLEILGETTLTLGLDQVDNLGEHHVLLVFGLHPEVTRFGGLQHGSLKGRMVVGQMLIEPDSYLTTFVETDHLIIDVEGSHLAVAVVEPSN